MFATMQTPTKKRDKRQGKRESARVTGMTFYEKYNSKTAIELNSMDCRNTITSCIILHNRTCVYSTKQHA